MRKKNPNHFHRNPAGSRKNRAFKQLLRKPKQQHQPEKHQKSKKAKRKGREKIQKKKPPRNFFRLHLQSPKASAQRRRHFEEIDEYHEFVY